MSHFWDEWKQEALAAGVPEDLAQLGRDVLRENHQHGWGLEADELQIEQLIEFVTEEPDLARRRWTKLLAINGA
jgi:predicted NAD-dependent protein-ADP-ribosyltransferase YbiA (DUF1768 family)